MPLRALENEEVSHSGPGDDEERESIVRIFKSCPSTIPLVADRASAGTWSLLVETAHAVRAGRSRMRSRNDAAGSLSAKIGGRSW